MVVYTIRLFFYGNFKNLLIICKNWCKEVSVRVVLLYKNYQPFYGQYTGKILNPPGIKSRGSLLFNPQH